MDIAAQQGYKSDAELNAKRTTAKVIAGGSLAEGIAGAAAIALAILGLGGVYPMYMLIIATIAVGAALLFEGGAISSRVSNLIDESGVSPFDISEIGSGMTAEFFAGIAGVVLGVLALLGIYPMLMISIAAIVFGAALVLGSGTTSRLNSFAYGKLENVAARMLSREAVYAASSVQLLIGIGAVTLGILALVGVAPPVTMCLIAMLIVGFSDMLSGSAISSRMMGLFRRP